MTWNSRCRRSLLFVPGHDARKLDRADTAGADTLILDLEDAVATSQKERAREEVSNRLRSAAFTAAEVAVRVNAPGTRYFEADLASVVAAGARLADSGVEVFDGSDIVVKIQPPLPASGGGLETESFADESLDAGAGVGVGADGAGDFADPDRFDLVIMATRGLSALEHALLGSVAESVLRRCRVPMLAVPLSVPGKTKLTK